MVRDYKIQAVDELVEKFMHCDNVYLTNFSGLNVAKITELRNRLRESNIEYKVVKNTLTKIAVNKTEMGEIGEYLHGPIGLVFGKTDSLAPARLLMEFYKENNKPEIKLGVINKKIYTPKQVEELAKLPSREVLLSHLLSSMKSPVTCLVMALNGILRNFVYVLNEVKKKKEC